MYDLGLAPEPGWLQESVREEGGRFTIALAERVQPVPYAAARRFLEKLQEIAPSGRILAKFIFVCRDMSATEDERHELIETFLFSRMVTDLPRDGFRGFTNIVERPLCEILRAASGAQVQRWIKIVRPAGRLRSPFATAPSKTCTRRKSCPTCCGRPEYAHITNAGM